MKKVIRLTESDLMRIVKRVIKENQDESDNENNLDKMINDLEKLNMSQYNHPKRNVTKSSMMKKYENFMEELIMSDLSDEEKDEYKNKFKESFKDIFRNL